MARTWPTSQTPQQEWGPLRQCLDTDNHSSPWICRGQSCVEPPALSARLLCADGPLLPALEHSRSWWLHGSTSSAYLCLKTTVSPNLCCCWFGPSISIETQRRAANIAPTAARLCSLRSSPLPTKQPPPSLFTSATIPWAPDTLSSRLPLPEPHHQVWVQLPAESLLILRAATLCASTAAQHSFSCCTPAAGYSKTNNCSCRCANLLCSPAPQPSPPGLLLAFAKGCVSHTGTWLTQQTTAWSQLP